MWIRESDTGLFVAAECPPLSTVVTGRIVPDVDRHLMSTATALNRFGIRVAVTIYLALFATAMVSPAAETNNATPALVETKTNSVAERSVKWAQRIESPGLSNLYQVTADLFRGAQPTAEGMAKLKAMGIKTVINLRSFHTDKDELTGTGLRSVRFAMQPWNADDAEVIRFLRVISDTNNLPAFVHCRRGADRTGMMCAMYRVAVCGWTKQEAIEEMEKGGFAFSPAWKNLVRYIEKSDVARLKREAETAVIGKASKP